jgi:DNA-binding GntR family transcriptional regulator
MNDRTAQIVSPGSGNGGETLASTVYERLRNDILTGSLKPGSKLRLQALKEHYDVGNSPLREALNRLSANGMVVREENRGFRVSPAGAKELLELIRTRCWLEEIAMRQSIINGDEEWEERIVLSYHWLTRADKANKAGEPLATSPEWEEHHQEFHLAMLSACDSEILVGYCSQLHEQTFRYRNLGEVLEYRERHELDEHGAIHDAVLDRNADLAVEHLKKHYEVTAEIVLASGTIE